MRYRDWFGTRNLDGGARPQNGISPAAPLPNTGGAGRRRFLQIGSLGLCGVNLSAALAAENAAQGSPLRARAKACILLYMDGGPSHIDLLDLKPQAPAEIRGPFQPIATSVPGIQIGDQMPLVARQMRHLTLIRSMRHQETVHDPAVYQMLTGFKHVSSAGGLRVEDTDLPQVGTAFGSADPWPAVMPKVIQIPETMKMEARILPGQSAGILGAAYDPFRVEVSLEAELRKPQFRLEEGVTSTRLTQRSALLSQFNRQLCRLQATRESDRLDRFQEQALGILERPSVEQAFDLERESASNQQAYGLNRHGKAVLLARRLVEAGARFVTVYWGHEPQDWNDGRGPRPANNPWDTHRNHFPLVKQSLVPRADRALSALLNDLSERGLLAETLVVWMGDFGRTPRISREWASRDHWPHAFSLLMAGGGLNAGTTYGHTDALGAYVTQDPVSPADLTATMFSLLGLEPHTVVRDAAGRPHRISIGAPISGILA